MPVKRFPDPRFSTVEGIVAVGGELDPDTLLEAYRTGIFPWPIENFVSMAWFCPEKRAILDFKDLHVPRSLEKARRQAIDSGVTFTVDQAFEKVIRACAKAKRPGQRGTWITTELLKAYLAFHKKGHAHSVEVWEPGQEPSKSAGSSPKLIGGIYGVDAGGAFAGESMFHAAPNASKLALLHLIEHLRARGLDWLDIQMLTPHMEALGAKEISRDLFLRRLAQTLSKELRLF